MKLMKKVGALLLSLALLMSLLPMAALAEPAAAPLPDGVPAEFVKLNLTWTNGCWNSIAPSGQHLILQTPGEENIYGPYPKQNYCTGRLTIDQIPYGSKIILQPGWEYRAEGWKADDSKNAERPALESVAATETAPFIVTVDEGWWGDFTTRAFNVRKTGVSNMATVDIAELEEAFAVYVPAHVCNFDAGCCPICYALPDNYVELDIEWQLGVYNSGSGRNPSTATKFFCTTDKFTIEDIPIGSVIVLQPGWQCQPEGWPDNGFNNTNTRPAYFKAQGSPAYVNVTEDWWKIYNKSTQTFTGDDFTVRAFNIQKNKNLNTVTLTDADAPAVKAALKIYVPHTHTYDNACDADCNGCGATRTPSEHVYANACDADCNVCGATRTPSEHVYDNACDTTCNVCGDVRTVGEHVYDNACDANCNVCEAPRTPSEHVYDNACDADCNVCEAPRTPAEHVYDNACDANCNVCEAPRTPAEHVYENACDADCNVCEAPRTPSEHVYANACDADCNVCGATRTPAEHVYDNACDANCNVCEAPRTPADHVYDNACDTTCNVCSATRTIQHAYGTNWEKDRVNHWHECTVCGAKEGEAAHTPDRTEPTETDPVKCTVCEGIITPALSHEHAYDKEVATDAYKASGATCTAAATYYKSCECGEKGTETFTSGNALGHTEGTEWKSDAENHWHICTAAGCGAVIDSSKAAHTPDHQGGATEEYAIKCTVCEYEMEAQLTHTHVYDKEVATDAYKASGATCTAAATYYKSCECGEKGTETFTSGNALGHTEGTEWKSDAENHWHICTAAGCGAVIDSSKAAHADANIDGKCDACAYELPVDDNPQTGDNSMITLWVVLLCVSAMGIVATMIFRKKRAF